MPIQLKNYTWSQTEEYVTVVIPVKGILPSKADVYCNSVYVKVNSSPYLFELDLFKEVEDKKSIATFGKDAITLTLYKTVSGLWEDIVFNANDRDERMKRRNDALEKDLKRTQEEKEILRKTKAEKDREMVRKQIEVERSARKRTEDVKKRIQDQVKDDLLEWTEHSNKETKIESTMDSNSIFKAEDNDSEDDFQSSSDEEKDSGIRQPTVTLPPPRQEATLEVRFTRMRSDMPAREKNPATAS